MDQQIAQNADSGFVHLHVHSEYSLLDGAARIKDLVATAKEQGMSALAITDHGVMYGVMDFYKEAKRQGIKPILGCEVYVAPRSRSDKVPQLDESPFHLVLLAENQTGYRNLLKLVSLASLEGFYYKPRVDKELLRQYSEGVIALSACLGGEVPRLILKDQPDAAKQAALNYQSIFGVGNFFLEIQDHGIAEQRKVNLGLIQLSESTGIPLVATNDLHYVRRNDAKVQDVLLCIQTGKTLADTARMNFGTDEFYLKTEAEMNLAFGEYPEALANTARIAARCTVEFSFGQTHLPVFAVPAGYTLDSFLAKQCWNNLELYYPATATEVKERLNYELGVIHETGFSGYFLIVADFCAYARTHGVIVGPGRGSAAGSLVAYLLGITTVDPIQYGLLFERFLNPERVSMPDIDIDFDPEGREKVIEYVIARYGSDKVAQIITFGTMAAKAAVRDVGRAMGLPLTQVDKVAKLIPSELKMTIQRALEMSPDLNDMYQQQAEVHELLDMAMAVEGMPRHSSTHAAGVVIAKEPVMNYLPLQKTSDGVITTQFPMKTVEEIGLLKMDFLGLRNLSIIDGALRLIKANKGREIELAKIPMDDAVTYQLLASGDTTGVFQLESSGMRAILKDLKPSVFDDIIAVNALYRPGPMDQIPEFIRRKQGVAFTYLHPKIEPILQSTYGIMVYQEQVMQIARDLAGYSLGRADLLRRAMGKKKKEIMDEERRNFVHGLDNEQSSEVVIPGAMRLGISEVEANAIFDLMAKFAEYGFNKGHATAYAVISYQTAWLKANYPLEFMAALLSSVVGSPDKVSYYIEECRKMGIEILPPDVNESGESFSISDKDIRFGLAAIKNVGIGVVQAIIHEREARGKYSSLADLCQRVEGKTLNKRVLESLIKSGAVGSLRLNRAQLLQMLEPSIEAAQARQRDLASGQISLFDFGTLEAGVRVTVPDVSDFSRKEILAMEKELLGLYLSGHPLHEVAGKLSDFTSHQIAELSECNDGLKVILAGVINGSRKTVTKRGETMAYFSLEDLSASIEVLVFPKSFLKLGLEVVDDRMVLVEGRLAKNDEESRVFAENIIPLEAAMAKAKARRSQFLEQVYIKLPSTSDDAATSLQIKQVLARFPGPNPVYLFFAAENKVIATNPDLWVEPSEEFKTAVSEAWGPDSYKVKFMH
ncbi:MAG: DNA polymerase III subunit alpha [Peptococcaceae bacterium]|nr:DNA polymerase III subunit alpha [Peptococcaceae bacterium]